MCKSENVWSYFDYFQCVGVGKMRPNVVFLGFKNNWVTQPQATSDYFNIIHDALDLKYGVGILRLRSGLDFSDFFGPGKINVLGFEK
jgi:hypothetical protein